MKQVVFDSIVKRIFISVMIVSIFLLYETERQFQTIMNMIFRLDLR